MSEPESPPSKIDLLLAKADEIQAALSTIESAIDTKLNSAIQSSRRNEENDDGQPPAWAKRIINLLNRVREGAQCFRAELQVITSQSDHDSNTRSNSVSNNQGSCQAKNVTPRVDSQPESRTEPANESCKDDNSPHEDAPTVDSCENATVQSLQVRSVKSEGDARVEPKRQEDSTIRYEAGPVDEGYARVYISTRKPNFDWAAFTEEVQRPTIEQAKGIFEEAVQKPPEGHIPYLVGHANIPLDNPLNPGPSLLKDPDLIDLHTGYHHIGASLSGNRIHCEDMTTMDTTASPEYNGFRSYNEVYFGPGYKLWLLIAMHHTAKFYDFAERNWTLSKCNQRLGHQCLLLAPSRLEKEGIDFRIEVVGCGEAIITQPGELHAVVNYGPCAARSMNYLLPTDKLEPDKLTYCVECGLSSVCKKKGAARVKPLELLESGKLRKRKASEELPRPSKKTRTSTAARRRLAELEAQIQKWDSLCRLPRMDRHDPDPNQLEVLEMVASVRSSTAIQQFMDLVGDWRRRNVHMVVSDNTGDDLQQQGKRLKAAIGKSSLSKFVLRYAQSCVARGVDKQKEDRGDKRLSAGVIEELAQQLEMDSKVLKRHLEDGRMWNSLCGPHDGLLPFFLLDSKQYLHISKKELKRRPEQLKAFHSLLEDCYTEDICRAGRTFQKIIANGSYQVFRWEKESLDLEAEDRASLLWRTKGAD
ncbi:hypothetical protein QQX98_010521 [Neonectria punicea]|uniref:JmjC domain-containing protein n=1 Tax=Neonectria punicea TaxID=979145 RepID=A0ABR1GPQ2_9HYPO